MSKRNNITYIKPEPKFLQQLKAQIGYKNEPTIDTKRQKFDNDSDDSDRSDFDEEAPQVVVVKKGDLTAEQAAEEQKRIEKEENETPADLSQRIVFKSKKIENPTTSISETKTDKKHKKRPEPSKSKLSFQIEDEDEDEE